MWLILCSGQDISALWAYHGLQWRGLTVELVTAESLTANVRWVHTVGLKGANTNITLADGRMIDSRLVRGVVNRLTHVPLQHLRDAPDFEYATQEYTALFMSWLKTLRGPIYNGVDAQGLSGAWRHASEWVWLASLAGLKTLPYKQSSDDQFDETTQLRRVVPEGTSTSMAIALGDQVFGPNLPPQTTRACRELARISKTPLLGIELVSDVSSHSWAFAGATPMPDLRLGGEPLLDALAAHFFQSENGYTL